MRLVDRHKGDEAIEECSGELLMPDGSREPVKRPVLAEHVMEVSVNTVPTMRIVCTPNHLVDLVIGRLYTEGIIEGIAEIEEVYLCDQGTRASVLLTVHAADFSHRGVEVVPSCCTGNRVYNQYFANENRPDKVVPSPWKPEWIFVVARMFADDTPLHRTTMGTHSCYLVLAGEVVICCEDLGRHNAFDKVIGSALRQGIDLRNALVYSSGRLPVDMVMKAIRGGIPILATKAVPTDETIRLAREYDLTLVCQARPDSMTVYNDPMRKREGS